MPPSLLSKRYGNYSPNLLLSLLVSGFDQVVLGDLVYCKGDDTEKETVGVNSECNDDNCDDTYDCSHLDETSGTDLLERKNTLVKVSSYIIAIVLIFLLFLANMWHCVPLGTSLPDHP